MIIIFLFRALLILLVRSTFSLVALSLLFFVSYSSLYGQETKKPLLVDFSYSVRGDFGITVTDDPLNKKNNLSKSKKLTFTETGNTNNLMVLIDNKPIQVDFSRIRPKELELLEGEGKSSQHSFIDKSISLELTQTVKIIEGEQSGNLDTVLAVFSLKNNSKRNHSVSFRYMVDTFIGSNDGVPFTIPNHNGLCTTWANFNKPLSIPEYIEALEFPNLANPGTVAHLGTIVSAKHGNFAPIIQVLLTNWPGLNPLWNIPIDNMGRDSAIALYWKPVLLKPEASYECAFTYGLQPLTKSEGSSGLALSTGGVFETEKNAIIIAYIDKPTANEYVTLEMEGGLKLSAKTPAKQKVKILTGQPYAQVTWQVKCESQGSCKVSVTRSNEDKVYKEIRVR